MKTLNIIITILILLLIIGSLIMQNDIITYKASIPKSQNDAQSGIGTAIILIIWWSVNSILCFILFATLLILSIIKKRISDIHTIINLILLIITFLTPFIFLDY